MKVLVLGGDGMLGHELLIGLSGQHEVRVTLREDLNRYAPFGLFDDGNAYDHVDVRRLDRVREVLADLGPHAVVNAVGIVKQRAAAKESIPSIEVNALFPHCLAAMAQESGARLIHISTDCVFSGRGGAYTEDDLPDPVDLYGRSKLLGEVGGDGCTTLRTSIIGLELGRRQGLVEWALAQTGGVTGYRRARYNGLTTVELARVISGLLAHHPNLDGVWHVASEPISKHDLLVGLFKKLDRPVEVAADDTVVCDRTLRADAFHSATGYVAPSWDEMLDELVERIGEREERQR